jgi:hypothetical protein
MLGGPFFLPILPTTEILSAKNEPACVSMVLYLKIKIKKLKQKKKKNPVSHLEVAC